MHFSASITAASALLLLAAIPYSKGAVHQVTVGGPNILRYDPEFLNADPGDTIVFTFKQKNHTVTQSTFANPCLHASGGFDSGFQPVADNITDGPFPTAQLTVQDTNPIWVYCRQTGHCQKGMVFAVNPGSNFAAFQAAANASSATNTTVSSSTSFIDTTAPTASVVTVTATVTDNGGETITTTYGSYPGSSQPTSATSTDHKIIVGGTGKLFYDPANITAQVGDTITFQFMQKNHTVTQSSFNAPCRSLTSTSTSGQIGFDSGFMPVADNATTFPTFTIQVNNTAPIWAYCRQTNPVPHCGSGMVFAANAIESGPNNFAAFEALAKQLNGTSTTISASAPAASSSTSSNQNSGALTTSPRDAGITFVLLLIGAIFGAVF